MIYMKIYIQEIDSGDYGGRLRTQGGGEGI
jgi:hypothetical protein